MLLDRNVLIALAVPEHVHHEAAMAWFGARTLQFATCPITQGSLVRLLRRQGIQHRRRGCFAAGHHAPSGSRVLG